MRTNRDYTGLQRTPHSLGWLLRQRAAIRGQLDRRKKQLASLPLEICELLDCLTSLDRVIRMHEVPVEPSVVEAKLPQKVSVYKGKRLQAAILACLKEANGDSLFTNEITYSVVKKCKMNFEDYPFPELRAPVHKILQKLAARGKVVRHHNLSTTEEGRWSLVLSED